MSSNIVYRQQMVICSKPHCRTCQEGTGHGPYWYAYQTVNGRTIRTYIGRQLPPGVHAPEVEDTRVLRLSLLGRFRLERRVYGREWQMVPDVAWKQSYARSTLSYLLSSPGRKVSRVQAREALWPDLDTQTTDKLFEESVTELRQVLEPARRRQGKGFIVQSEGEWLALADQTLFWVDTDSFEELLAWAHAADDPGKAMLLLEQAASLYGGDFFPESAASWTLAHRQLLQRQWIGLLLDLADLRISQGSTARAIEILDRLLTTDPTNEAAVQRLMVALARQKRRTEALYTYQRFNNVLQQEHDIRPSEDTRALYEAIRRGEDLALPLKAVQHAMVSSGNRVSSLSDSPRIGRSNQSPLVGRERERDLIHALLLETERNTPTGDQQTFPSLHRPSCVLLLGEAGIGKTRLAEEAGREANARGWTVTWSHAYAQENNIPYHLWIEILRQAIQQSAWQRQALSRHSLMYQSLTAILPELQDLLPEVSISTVPPEQEQLRLWEAIRSLLIAVSESTPLFIMLDDLQWADASSIELLGYLIRHLDNYAIMLVGTCRESELSPGHPLQILLADLQREQRIEILTLEPLTDTQIAALLAELPSPLIQPIQTRAAGNPFFAEELARGVQNLPLLPDQHLTLPATIAAVLDQRLSRLSLACQQFLSKATIFGGSFQFSPVSALEESHEDRVLSLLEEALRARVLIEEGSGTHITYHFWHPLLLDHLSHRLSATRRISLHRRAAEALRQLYHKREEEGAAAIAYHLTHGGAESPQVAHYAEMAGDFAYKLSAYPEAEHHYRLAVEHRGILAADASREELLLLASILERLGECTMIQGKFEEARHFYESVFEGCGQQQGMHSEVENRQEAQRQAILWSEIGWTWRHTGDLAQAHNYCTRGEQQLRTAGVTTGPALASLRYLYSSLCWQEGRYDEAYAAALEALSLFEQQQEEVTPTLPRSTRIQRTLEGDPVNQGRIYRLLSALAATVGKNAEALDYLNEALVIFERYGHQREIAIVSANLGDLYLRMAKHSQAEVALRRALDIFERMGDRANMSVCFGNLGILAARSGDLTTAESWYERGLTLAEQVNDPGYVSLWYAYLAADLRDQGRLLEAVASLRRALSTSRAARLAPCIGFSLVILGSLRITQTLAREQAPRTQQHLLERARSALEHALAMDGLESETTIEGRISLAHVALMRGDIEHAHKLAMYVLDEARLTESPWLIARAYCLLGSVLAKQDQYEQAEEFFLQALNVFRETSMRLECARTLYSYGAALLQRKQNDQQGLNALAEACQIFRECHANLDLQVTERLVSGGET